MIQAERRHDRAKDRSAKRQSACVGDNCRWPTDLVDPEHARCKIGSNDTASYGLNRTTGGPRAGTYVEDQLAGQANRREADEHFCKPVVDKTTGPELPSLPRAGVSGP